ncbi:hypothetical protein ACVWZK_005792 [Bradyrhizobium sp. GM0.4]
MSAALGLKAKPIANEPADDDSDISALINRLTAEVNQIAVDKTKAIQQITNQMKMLALNALIESSRAGAQGAGFAVVAQEVRGVGQQVETIARELESQLTKRTGDLVASIDRMSQRSRGERMVDLSLNAIELIDRNLYERTCDVRWWATDSALVGCAASPDAAAVSHASQRLGVILGAYTVYLDLWLCDLDGNVIANGRADRFRAVGQNVAHTKWFREAKTLRSGDDYVAGDRREPAAARQCPGRDLLRQRPRRRPGQRRADRGARHPFRLGGAGPRHRARRARWRQRQGARAAGRLQSSRDRRFRRTRHSQRTHLAVAQRPAFRLLPGRLGHAGRVPCDARLRDLSRPGLVRRDRLRGLKLEAARLSNSKP